MSKDELPPELQELVEKLKQSGIQVDVAAVKAKGAEVAAELEKRFGQAPAVDPFTKVMNEALAGMRAAGFDGHRTCLVLNSMQMVASVLGPIHATAIHMVDDHDSIPAMEWLLQSIRFTDAMTDTIAQAEIDTGHAFDFTSKDPGAAAARMEMIAKLERDLAAMRERAAVAVH